MIPLITAVILLGGCATKPKDYLTLKNHNKLPITLQNTPQITDNIKTFKIPGQFLKLKKIARKTAEARIAPTLKHTLNGVIFEKDDLVIEIASAGIWRKVYAPEKNLSGWVHYKTLKDDSGQKRKVFSIKKRFLSRVFPIKKRLNLKSYKTKRKKSLKAPKLRPFYTLKSHRDKILVIIEETKSVAWLFKKEVI